MIQEEIGEPDASGEVLYRGFQILKRRTGKPAREVFTAWNPQTRQGSPLLKSIEDVKRYLDDRAVAC